MARVKGAMMTRKRRKKVLKLAKGYFGAKSTHFKMAKQAVMKSGNYDYVGRKQRKRDFRILCINRKMLSEIAINDPAAFTSLVEKAKAAL